MLDRIWQTHGTVAIVQLDASNSNSKPLHIWTNNQSYAQVIATLPNTTDLYFTPSVYERRSRRQGNVTSIQAFWLDIDCGRKSGYASKREAIQQLQSFLKETGIPKPNVIIDSGYGIHIYWVLDQPMRRDAWNDAAQRLKRACTAHGLRIDPARTADAASIMRLPGTYNHKNGKPVEVKTLHDDHSTTPCAEFVASLPSLGPRRVVNEDAGEWSTQPTYPPGDIRQIVPKCRQIREAMAVKGAVPEPLWRGMLSVLWRCEGGGDLIHGFSTGDDRYDSEQTEAKARGTTGPYTCETFRDLNPSGCEGCPHAGKITSPINLGVAAEPAPASLSDPTQPTTAETRFERISGSGPYSVNRAGVWYSDPDAEDSKPQCIVSTPLYVLDVEERVLRDEGRNLNNSAVYVEWIGFDGKPRYSHLPQPTIYDNRLLTEWLAKNNLRALVMDIGKLRGYISHMTREKWRRQAVSKYYDTLGWYNDGFVLGGYLIDGNGSRPAHVNNNSMLSTMAPKGDVGAWTRAMAVLDRPGLEMHQFIVLASFGSILHELGGVTSAVVSAVGQSGYGKTLSSRVGLSIYGSPDILIQAGNATDAAVQERASRHRNIPYLLDEVTNMDPKRLGQLIYMLADGRGRERSGKDLELKSPPSWWCVPIITGNHPILDQPQHIIQEAHRRRVVEIHFDTEIDGETARHVNDVIQSNYGVVGVDFIRAIAGQRDRVPDWWRAVVDDLTQRYPNIPSANRHALWLLAGATMGGRIAKQLGLIGWDVDAVVDRVANQLSDDVKETSAEIDRLRDAVVEFIAAYSKHISEWRVDSKTNMGTIVDDPVGRILDDDRVALHSNRFRVWCQAQRLNMRAVQRWWEPAAQKTSMRLSPGTPPVRATVVTLSALGIDKDRIMDAATDDGYTKSSPEKEG